MNLEIQRTLVVSTAHVTKVHMNLLTQANRQTGGFRYPDLIVDSVGLGAGYGVRLVASSEAVNQCVICRMPEVAALVQLALNNQCCWLQLDRDGPKVEGYPEYEW